jgi:predicted amidohydrolase YtcJ
MTVIYAARRILTMNPANLEATHVAVRGDRILGAGSLEELAGWGEYQLDTRFADKILMPGLVEGHSHASEGSFWRYVYCGNFDRVDPDGKTWPGLKSLEDVIERLKVEDRTLTDDASPIGGWSLDPIYYGDIRFSRADFDQVSTTRPVGVRHASGHIMNVNTRALKLGGLLRSGINHPGVPLGEDGLPTGELKGPDAMEMVALHVGLDRKGIAADEPGLRQFSRLCVRQGVTTAADLANPLPPEAVEMMLRLTDETDFPVRIVSLRRFQGVTPHELIERSLELREMSTDRLRLGHVKIHADGSIQGFTARLRWPGYYNGAPNGLWYATPEQLQEIFELALEHDLLVHIHTNGDEATELTLDILQRALYKFPRADHRFTLQHCQLADAAQFRRMKKLGVCVNLFSNHAYYWGDQHYEKTVGPERAQGMNACATALREGVPLAIHSDAPVTPLGPFFTAWCAVNRLTPNGRVLGNAERISVEDALRTITLGAAYTLKLDDEIGSIETGKRADFTILEDDPTEIGGVNLKDVRIWGVVQGGRIFSAKAI